MENILNLVIQNFDRLVHIIGYLWLTWQIFKPLLYWIGGIVLGYYENKIAQAQSNGFDSSKWEELYDRINKYLEDM